MKLVIVTNLYPPYFLGGYEILCEQVCRALANRGHDVSVLTSTHGVEKGNEVEALPNIHRILRLYNPFERPVEGPMRRKRWIVGKHNRAVTKAFLAQETPELIFIWSQLRLSLGPARAAQASRIPVAYTLNDFHIAGYRPVQSSLSLKDLGKYVAEKWVFSGITFEGLDFSHTTCISKMLKQELLKKDLPIESAKVIYQGIPIEQFPLKDQPGKIGNPAKLLYVGQLHPYKGVHTLIHAAHLVSANVQGIDSAPSANVVLSIVGDGPKNYLKELKKLSSKGPARIEFVGKLPRSKLSQVYQSHDIFIFPSTWQEPFGLTHLEAMASGTPVISTADGGHGEFLKHGENALIFEKENPKQLADQISRLLQSSDLSIRLAHSARDHVAQRFTLERYVDDIEAFLQAVTMKEKR